MDVSYLLVRLQPLAPFHLGKRGIGLEETETFVHSDTLFSALCNVWVRCFGRDDLENRFLPSVEASENGSLFQISSAFPYAHNVLFFSRPLMSLPVQNVDPKKLKHCRFLSQQLFDDLIHGREIVPASQDRIFWLSKTEQDTHAQFESDQFHIWKETEVPRVSLDRVTQSSNIFYFSQVTFAEGCGLFFLVNLDASLRPDFEMAMRVLGDTGIGGDRTAGYGQFEPQFSECTLNVPDNASQVVTLSLLSPRDRVELSSLLGELSTYELIRRDGWIDSPDGRNYRRRACLMFAEGSVINRSKNGLMGRLVDVTPTAPEVQLTHKVYRYGIGFPVPLCLREEGV